MKILKIKTAENSNQSINGDRKFNIETAKNCLNKEPGKSRRFTIKKLK
jgi:hypothetical protein